MMQRFKELSAGVIAEEFCYAVAEIAKEPNASAKLLRDRLHIPVAATYAAFLAPSVVLTVQLLDRGILETAVAFRSAATVTAGAVNRFRAMRLPNS